LSKGEKKKRIRREIERKIRGKNNNKEEEEIKERNGVIALTRAPL